MSMVGWTVATARTKVYGIRLAQAIMENEEAAVAAAKAAADAEAKRLGRNGAMLTDADVVIGIDKIVCDGPRGCQCEHCKKNRVLAGIGEQEV